MKGFLRLTLRHFKAKEVSLGIPKALKENEVNMMSSVTNVSFLPQCQKILREVSKKKGYVSRYWLTRPQAQRTCNAIVLPTEKPTNIHLQVKAVVPLKSLSKPTQQKLLDEFPPFFGNGVGIFSSRQKWKAVTAERLVRFLNPQGKERVLFVDLEVLKEMNIKHDPKNVIDIRSVSSVLVFNAEQLDDPYKGEPQKGLAIDAITGKRFSQPAHDILLGVGLLRGYTSPMWVSQLQLKHLNLELKPNMVKEAVAAPNMMGLIVPLSVLPHHLRKELLDELTQNHPDAFGYDIFFIYNVNGWEATRSKALVKHMAAINDGNYPYHFVNLKDLQIQKPRYSYIAKLIYARCKPIGVSLFENSKNESPALNPTESRLAIQTAFVKRTISFFFAEDVTLRRYYNACCVTKPFLMMPSVRPLAILNGRVIGKRDGALLRAFAIKNCLSSPLWLTESAARRLGINIHPKHKKHFITTGIVPADDSPKDKSIDGFYNIDDFQDPGEILALFPKTSKRAHFMLDAKWRPIQGKQSKDYLDALGRKIPLWVSVNECLMSGFEPKQNAKLLNFPLKKKKEITGARLYNSQYTTDPVRAIGLSTMFVRPQGFTL